MGWRHRPTGAVAAQFAERRHHEGGIDRAVVRELGDIPETVQSTLDREIDFRKIVTTNNVNRLDALRHNLSLQLSV